MKSPDLVIDKLSAKKLAQLLDLFLGADLRRLAKKVGLPYRGSKKSVVKAMVENKDLIKNCAIGINI